MLLHRSLTPSNGARPEREMPEWEETACGLCGRDDAALVIEASDPMRAAGKAYRFAVVRCRHCGLVYTNPRPTAQSLTAFYPPHYPPYALAKPGRPPRSVPRIRSRLFGRPCPERRGELPWPHPGRLLDFGCGGGDFLCEMASRGWKVTGLDISPQMVEAIRERFGLAAFSGTLPHPDVAPGSFDVITMWQSLEHVHRPASVLRAAYEALTPGGKLVIAVPNFESQTADWFGEDWFGLDLPRHMTHFTPQTLGSMLQACGFRIEKLTGWVHADWLRTSAQLALRSGRGGSIVRLLRSKPVSRLAAWMGYLRCRADAVLAVAERPA